MIAVAYFHTVASDQPGRAARGLSTNLWATALVRAIALFAVVSRLGASVQAAVDAAAPLVNADTVFEVRDGQGAVEAEHFFRQTRTDKRAFYVVHRGQEPNFVPDGDPPHVAGASNGAYVEVLPDTRRNHRDRLIVGENFSNDPGALAVVHYKVHIDQPGRYYVWVRAYSTGSEDNGLHVGLDGQWPASGQRLQWCEGKRSWRWESKQRTQQEHCGEPHAIYLDIDEAGVHEIQFSMREDGFEFDKWMLVKDRRSRGPGGAGPPSSVGTGPQPPLFDEAADPKQVGRQLVQPRGNDGDGTVRIAGELKQWHKVTLDVAGPYAHELDNVPNPFCDYRMEVRFRHESGAPDYFVAGYFAADGDAANSSAQAGTTWRAHLSPDKAGQWNYRVRFRHGLMAAVEDGDHAALSPYDGLQGTFDVLPTDKSGRDLRGQGRLAYVGKRYLQFAGNKKYFLKVGADAPETFLGYADFDGTVARKKNVPLKTWSAHEQDWRVGDPMWQAGKGKGIIGAVNYLASKGCNAFSFIPYNAGGDGDNVWPMVDYNEKLHYDCSKLDQWQIVFDHATQRGMYLHFKLQETENDDLRGGGQAELPTPTALDGGGLGIERKLYCREIVARFGHELALNWNLGEENTQTTQQQQAMAAYLRQVDPYDHHLVIHTYPDQQDQVYRPLLGPDSDFTGASLQNSHIKDTHPQTVKWVRASAAAGKPWVVAFDESGSAAHGQPPDLGYEGFDGRDRNGQPTYTRHEVRRQTLWGTLMGGGAGVEYYFGYLLPQNDLICENWRSRDAAWDDCRRALEFFHNCQIPFWDMEPADELVGNPQHDNRCYCLACDGHIYVIYRPNLQPVTLDLRDADGRFSIRWYDPRNGGALASGSVETIAGGGKSDLGAPPQEPAEDWVVVVQRP
ncbi:MAG: hypothetical protein CMJ58_18725 [Planctomycetaceae bacterium]|nr:hypothetical protein [Planctomycetaceae bacterium]